MEADEINRYYRTSDHERWLQNTSVVGIEVRLSNNHTCKNPTTGKLEPFTDICDELKGKYPKGFKWTGWHDGCRCYAVPIMKTDEERIKDYKKIANGEEPSTKSKNTINKLPRSIIAYVKKHPECKSESWYLDNIDMFNK